MQCGVYFEGDHTRSVLRAVLYLGRLRALR